RLRRIAETDIRASLQAHRELDLADAGRARERDLDLEAAAIDFLLAEELVAVQLAFGEYGRAERGTRRLGREAEPLAVEVVSVLDVEAAARRVRGGRHAVRVGFLGTQHVLRDGPAGRDEAGRAERRGDQDRA